jgi:hypothetical protein
MTMLGQAAMVLNFDVEPAVVAEHDRWHTQEHLPERLAIPGFRRGTRWVSLEGGLRYLVLYEVHALTVLESAAYRARLEAPTPWTQRLMLHYRAMHRGFCAVEGSTGCGWGHATAFVHFRLPPDAAAVLAWLRVEVLPALARMQGVGSAHLLQGVVAPSMTREQRLRGRDLAIDTVLLLSGWDARAVGDEARAVSGPAGLAGRGAAVSACDTYRLDYVVDRRDALPA